MTLEEKITTLETELAELKKELHKSKDSGESLSIKLPKSRYIDYKNGLIVHDDYEMDYQSCCQYYNESYLD